MRIAYVTESFPPDVNGVAHTAVRVAEHLVSRGHQVLVIAPAPAGGRRSPDVARDFPVARVPSVAVPAYPGFRVGLPGRSVHAAVARHRADLVHLAGPFVLGASAGAAARRLRLPVVAVYATDMPAYARAYHTGLAGQAICWRRLRRIHNAADRTLAPSTATAAELHARGVERVWLWARGVDSSRFDPARRSGPLRAQLAPGGEVLVGYVGRLAVEKRVDLLAQVATLPGVRLVIVGSGPAEAAARRALPSALFLGQRGGEHLATIYASLDVFAHSGPHGRMLGVPGVLARPLARRADQINLVMDAVADRFGTLHFDAAGDPETYENRMWAVDRLHPSERGHRLIARRFHAMLAAAGHQVGPPPDPEPTSPPPTRLAELTWLATKGTAWVLRRSTDLVPSLVAMAITECRSGQGRDPAGRRSHETHDEPPELRLTRDPASQGHI